MKIKGIFGCIFILASGVIYTVERYFYILMWKTLFEKSGVFQGWPTMHELPVNIFVILFSIVGFALLIFEFYDSYKAKTLSKIRTK